MRKLGTIFMAIIMVVLSLLVFTVQISAHGPSSDWSTNGLCPYWADYRITFFQHADQGGIKDSICLGENFSGTKNDNSFNGDQNFRDVGEVNNLNGIVSSWSINTGKRGICVHLYDQENLQGTRFYNGFWSEYGHWHYGFVFWSNDRARSAKVYTANSVNDC